MDKLTELSTDPSSGTILKCSEQHPFHCPSTVWRFRETAGMWCALLTLNDVNTIKSQE